MHNPFSSNVSPANLGLTYEPKTAVMPEEPTSLPAKIDALRKQADALESKFIADLAKIWAYYGGFEEFIKRPIKAISKSFLGHVKEIRYPSPTFFGGENARQKRFDFGNCFEELLEGNDTTLNYKTLDVSDIENIKRMVSVARSDEGLIAWLDSPFVEKQKKVYFEMIGFNFVVVLDFYAESGSESDILKLGAELKSTTQVTEKAFLKACNDFGYWLQYVLYNQVCPDGYEIYGVSKKRNAMFKVIPTKEHYDLGKKLLAEGIDNLEYYNIAHHFKAKEDLPF